MFKRLGFLLTLCAILSLVFSAFPGGPVWAQDNDPHATGLNLPTPEQADWMNRNFPVIQKIRLNALGLQRVNAERAAKGLRRLQNSEVDLAPVGAEAVFAAPAGTAAPSADIVVSLAALPGAVDNSTSPAFPPIRSQGNLGSCASWATTYYQFTYETDLARGLTASGGDNTVIFSPKWTYNQINRGSDSGSSFSDAYALELKNGAASWSNFPYDSNYLQWPLDPAVWNQALNSRLQSSGQIRNSDTDTLINDAKTQLANGHVLVYGTYVTSWVQKTLSNDPSTADDDAFAGQKVASYMKNTQQGGHGMTVVGYNDSLWCDLNGNGVVDTGEKGAFKVANSWGTSDWNKGFRWISYDALRTASAVSAAGTWPTTDRASSGIFQSGTLYTVTSASSYTPTMKAEVTLNTAKRGQLAISLGTGGVTAVKPTSTWNSKAVYNAGGNYAFDGTTTACDATFTFDFTDLAKSVSGNTRWFVGVSDSTSGDAATIKSFKLYSGNTVVAASSDLPKTADAGQVYAWVDYAPGSIVNQPPAASFIATPSAGNIPLTVNFDGSASNDPDGQISAYSWSFGDGSNTTGVTTSHTYNNAGQFTATLTVTDDKGATGFKSVVINDATSPVNQLPKAVISAVPTSGNIPLSVNFDGSASNDPDGHIASYAWTFGDGANGTGVKISHTYTASGQFTASLIVTDNSGATASKSVTINVTSPSPTPTPTPGTLNAPSNLKAAVSGKNVTLTWADNSDNEEGFYIERATYNWWRSYSYSRVGQVSANTVTFTQADSSGTFRYHVQAFSKATGQISGYSSTVSVTVR